MIDVAIARITHIEWEKQLEALLSKKRVVITISDHENCELGKWLYGSAIREYENIPEIELLESEHKLFHLAAERVTKWHNSPGISAQAEAKALMDFEEVKRRSKEIIYLLTLLEFKLIHENHKYAHPKKSIANPLKAMRSFLGL